MDIYLAIITTVLVLTQVIRLIQNVKSLEGYEESVERKKAHHNLMKDICYYLGCIEIKLGDLNEALTEIEEQLTECDEDYFEGYDNGYDAGYIDGYERYEEIKRIRQDGTKE